MSIKAISAVFERSTQVGTPLVVLLKLADHANDETWEAWPSVESLARAANVTRASVQKALRKLEAAGEIAAVKRGGAGQRNTTRYQVLPTHKGLARDAVGAGKGLAADAVANGKGLVADAPKGLAGDVKRLADDARTIREPSLEPSLEHGRERGSLRGETRIPSEIVEAQRIHREAKERLKELRFAQMRGAADGQEVFAAKRAVDEAASGLRTELLTEVIRRKFDAEVIPDDEWAAKYEGRCITWRFGEAA